MARTMKIICDKCGVEVVQGDHFSIRKAVVSMDREGNVVTHKVREIKVLCYSCGNGYGEEGMSWKELLC